MSFRKIPFKERWKVMKDPVFGNLYKVSNHGRVKSLSRVVVVERNDGIVYNRKINPKTIEFREFDGFLGFTVSLTDRDEVTNKVIKKSSTRYVHKEVAVLFIPNPDKEKYINVEHIDGNINNNASSNLRWITASDSIRKSTKNRTEKNKNVLRDYNIKKSIYRNIDADTKRKIILDYCARGLVYRELVVKYGYTMGVIRKVIMNK